MTVLLCAIDYEPPSALALARAVELLGTDDQAVLHVIHVRESPDVASGAQLGDLVADEPTRLAAALDVALRDKPEALRARIRTAVVPGADPAAQIARTAKEVRADLVVVATHGRKGVARLFVGSVAEGVVRQAPCSVLVVRAKEQAAAGAGS